MTECAACGVSPTDPVEFTFVACNPTPEEREYLDIAADGLVMICDGCEAYLDEYQRQQDDAE